MSQHLAGPLAESRPHQAIMGTVGGGDSRWGRGAFQRPAWVPARLGALTMAFEQFCLGIKAEEGSERPHGPAPCHLSLHRGGCGQGCRAVASPGCSPTPGRLPPLSSAHLEAPAQAMPPPPPPIAQRAGAQPSLASLSSLQPLGSSFLTRHWCCLVPLPTPHSQPGPHGPRKGAGFLGDPREAKRKERPLGAEGAC